MVEEKAKTLRVRDIMATDVVTVVAKTTVEDAARSLTFHQVSGAPVLEHGRIIGVVSKSDLVAPSHRSTPGTQLTVADVMTRVVYAVRPGDPAMAAVRLMVNEAVHRAVVVNDKGALVGIVSPMDILRALARGEPVIEADQRVHEHHAEPAVAFEFVDLRIIDGAAD